MNPIKNTFREIFPLEANFELRNSLEYLKPANIANTSEISRPRAFLLDAASYDNLGDQAITYAIFLFLKEIFGERYVEVSERMLLRNLKRLKRYVKPDDIICLNGGGNMGTRYPRYEAIRRKVIKFFPDNKIVIFPQTIDYEDTPYGRKEFSRAVRLYNSNKNLLVCAREGKTFDIFSRYYQNYCFAPDIVFNLYGKMNVSAQRDNSIGVCLRDDSESTLDDYDRKKIYNAIEDAGFKSCELSTMASHHKIIEDNKLRGRLVTEKLKEFAECRCVITDRLHGMIFSILAFTPCLIIDNANGKVFGVYESVRHLLIGVKKAKDINTIGDELSNIVDSSVTFDTTGLGYVQIKNWLKSRV